MHQVRLNDGIKAFNLRLEQDAFDGLQIIFPAKCPKIAHSLLPFPKNPVNFCEA